MMRMGVSVFCFWTVNFLINLVFPVALSSLGFTTIFYFCRAHCFGNRICNKIFPETKGHTLEQLEKYFCSYDEQLFRSTARKAN